MTTRGFRGRKALILSALLASLPLVSSGCGAGEGKAEARTKAPVIVPVTVVPLERRTVERSVPIEGSLRAWEQVTVGAKTGGRVVQVRHDIGDRVKPGELLVVLDPTDAQLAVQQAEAKYLAELSKLNISRSQAESFVKKHGLTEALYRGEEADQIINSLPAIEQARVNVSKARMEYNRQKQLYDRSVGTLQDLQNSENDFRGQEAALDNAILTARNAIASALVARAALDVAEDELEDTRIEAPQPSTPEGKTGPEDVTYAITRRDVSEGQLLKDGESVFELVVEDPIRLWMNVPERYRPRIALEQTVRINAQSRPDETFEGQVARINPSVDPVSRTVQVEAVFPNPENKLRPGGFAKGRIITGNDENALVVPLESVYQYAGVTKIFLVENKRAHGVPVQLGRQLEDGYVEIFGDELPTEGDVVTTGLTKLAENTSVVVRDPLADQQAEPTGEEKAQPIDSPQAPAEPVSAPKVRSEESAGA